MYLHLGQDTVVLMKDIIGIFDIETSTISQTTRDMLAAAQKSACNQCFHGNAKSFILCKHGDTTTVYISQISSLTLLKRAAIANATSKL
jgi:extracellular matrix regulatory protein B